MIYKKLQERVENQLKKMEQAIKNGWVNDLIINEINDLIDEAYKLESLKERDYLFIKIIRLIYFSYNETNGKPKDEVFSEAEAKTVLNSFKDKRFKLLISNPNQLIYRRGYNTESFERGIGHYCGNYSDEIKNLSRQEYRDAEAVLSLWGGLLNGELSFCLKPNQVILQGLTASQYIEGEFNLEQINHFQKYNNFQKYKAFEYDECELEELKRGNIQTMLIKEFRDGGASQFYIFATNQVDNSTIKINNLFD